MPEERPIPSRERILTVLDEREIPFILIGAQALRVYGSSRESYDVDFAARLIDSDAIIELMYGLEYILPDRIDSDTDEVVWSGSVEDAKKAVNEDRRGGLNFYFLDVEGRPVDQIDFVTDIPIPFVRLKQNARLIRETPPLLCASPADLIAMKRHRIEHGYGSPADRADLEFLLSLPE